MTFSLNPAQEIVAATLQGKVLVSAGAGTGKTRALTERFARAVAPFGDERPGVEADRILTITFTEKAAGEIAERIRTELRRAGRSGEAARLEGAWISTIHGFGRRVLRRHALEAGIDPDFSVADEVIGGFLGDEAMERALETGAAGCAQVGRLVEAYGVPEVSEAVRMVARELRSRGLGPESLAVEPAATAEDLRERAVEMMGRLEADFASHAGSVTAAATNREACRSAADQLRELGLRGSDPEQVAHAVWSAMTASWPRRARAAAVLQVAEELAEARRRLAGEAARIMVQPLLVGLTSAVERYLAERERLKSERGLLDFDDLQARARILFRDDPTLADRYARAFRLVMVDEFQDTDEVQLDLIEAVSAGNLCTVGDERQSIYGFRGADVEVYRRHRHEMRAAGALPVDLVENYRAHPGIITFVNRLFEASEFFGPELPSLEASREEDPHAPRPGFRVALEVVRADKEVRARTDQTEAESLAERFEELRDAGFSPDDMVVLVRAYSKEAPLSRALRQRGFDVEVVGGSRFFELTEVATLLALCEVIANPLDEVALARLILSDMSAVSDEGAAALAIVRDSEGGPGSLWEALGQADVLLAVEDAKAALGLKDLVERAVERAATGSLVRAVARAVEESGLDLLYAADETEGLRAFANVQKFLHKLERFERSGEAGAAAFAARLRAEERYGSTESPARPVASDSAAVRIMSIHAAKGLEFPVVAVPFMGDRPPDPSGLVRTQVQDGTLGLALRLPTEIAEDAPKGFGRTEWFDRMHERAKEERVAEGKRLLYVACTRAREALVLTGTLKGDKAAEDMGESPLAWSRRALGALERLPSGGSETRNLGEGHSIEVTVRDVVPEESGTADDEWGGRDTQGPPRPGERSNSTAEERQDPPGGPPSRGDRRVGERAPVAPLRLSATDVAVYRVCSLRYWAERVVRFGEVGATPGSGPRAFGAALHALLQLDLPGAGAPGEEQLIRVARFHGLAESATARLRQVLETWRSAPTRRDLHACDRVWTEYPFVVPMLARDGCSFELVGAIDAWGCRGSEALIVDYKSGTGEAGQEELRRRYEDQAAVYAFALLSGGMEAVDVRFVRPEVECGNKMVEEVRFEFGPEDRGRMEAMIREAYEDISAQPYRPLERWDHRICPTCGIAGSACPLTPLWKSGQRGAG